MKKFSGSYPKVGDLSTKGRGLEDEIENGRKGEKSLNTETLRHGAFIFWRMSTNGEIAQLGLIVYVTQHVTYGSNPS